MNRKNGMRFRPAGARTIRIGLPSVVSLRVLGASVVKSFLVLFGLIWCCLAPFGPKFIFCHFFRVAWIEGGIRVERKFADGNFIRESLA